MIPEPPLWSTPAMLGLALAAALLPFDRERRLGAAGLLLLALGLAAWRAGSPPELGLTPPDRLGRGFLVGNGALLLLGTALLGVAAIRSRPAPLRLWARTLTGLGIVAIGSAPAAFLAAAGPARVLVASAGFALAGAALVVGARAVAASRLARTATRLLVPSPLVPRLRVTSEAGRFTVIGILLAAASLAALAPHLGLVFAGVMAAAGAGYLGFQPDGARPFPVAPLLTLLLVPVYWLLATIAGPLGLSLAGLPELPVSPAAEMVLAAALLLAGWATTGLWPLQRQLPGALVAPAGALLLARVAVPLAPVGLEYWRPLAVPLLVLGLWHAGAAGRWPAVVAGAGFLGMVGGPAAVVVPGAVLLATGLALELSCMTASASRAMRLVRLASWPLAAGAGLPVLTGVLRGEVVYTTVGVLGVAVIVVAGPAVSGEALSRTR